MLPVGDPHTLFRDRRYSSVNREQTAYMKHSDWPSTAASPLSISDLSTCGREHDALTDQLILDRRGQMSGLRAQQLPPLEDILLGIPLLRTSQRPVHEMPPADEPNVALST